MHFDQRTQQALRDVGGLSTDQLERVADEIIDATQEEAMQLESFFDRSETMYSDMDLAHSSDKYHEHTVEVLDVYTHAADLRGYLRFNTWGVYVEDGRVLSEDLVELALGPTVHRRVRFSPDQAHLP